MKILISGMALLATLSAFGEAGAPDRISLPSSEIQDSKIVLRSSIGHYEESCSGSGENESCHNYWVLDYKTTGFIEVELASSDVDVSQENIRLKFEGTKATVETLSKEDLYYEIETEKFEEIVSKRQRNYKIKLTITPRLQSKTFASMKMEKVKFDGDVLTYETLPETGVEMETELATSEKKLLFYSLVSWKVHEAPIAEVEARAGKLVHRIHLREIPEVKAWKKYRFTLYRSTKKANSLGRFTSAVLKKKM